MRTVWFENGEVKLINQRLLPQDKKIESYSDYRLLADAIKNLTVRGAPAIGIAAAFAFVLAAQEDKSPDKMKEVSSLIKSTRPTAVNLFRAASMMEPLIERGASVQEYLKIASQIEAEDDLANRKMGKLGAKLIENGDSILTHCNAGGLATGGFGTAVGIIKQAFTEGKDISVFVDETRPLLQGARLTAWELSEEGIAYTLITDNMAAYFMGERKITKVIVGADRIAANGDTANKIGTYGIAILASYHNIPFYVAAPISTLDLSLASGKDIPIEYRSPMEVTSCAGKRIAPEKAEALNPAFDITPAKLITGIITERKIVYPPFKEGLPEIDV